jgi:hypothetical protein
LIVVAAIRVYFYFWRSLPRLRLTLIKQLHLDTADEQLAAKRETAVSAVRGEVLKNILGLIASASQPFFQDRLYVPETPDQPAPAPYKATTGRGLSEVLNSTHEVPTAVHRDLLQTFENLPGASIGICGPRGAGKSTLLWSLCSGNRKVGGRDAITVYTAAPVEYETRDFILHIFSCVCQQALKAKGVTENRGLPFDEQDGNNFTKPLLKQQSRVGWILVWLGASIVLLSLFFTVMIWDPGAALDIVPSQPATQTSAPAAGATAQGSSASGATSQAPKVGATSSKGFIEVMEVKPGPLLLWGAAGTLLGALLIISDQLSRLRDKYGDGRPVHPLIRLIVRPRRRTAPGDPLAIRAQQHLHDIRFQRSYSSGWSGALKIPAGFETGTTLGTSLAQKQESLPEIVERFRSFVELITREFSRVIIGIDELDKLKSETDARKFINEIKAVFNIPNCFYLVSVSENAISNFERRGMPFRDEFDSAFDDIRHVDYLTLDGSRRLLGRRVLNLPEIFSMSLPCPFGRIAARFDPCNSSHA